MTIAAARLRCPDCAKPIGPLAGPAACPGCGRAFAPVGGVWDLRPNALAPAQANEDRAQAGAGEPTWRRLVFHKRYWLEWCDTRWLPQVVDRSTRTFLEIGGGLCYASALAKARAPDAWVAATDVSPRYLRRDAVRAGAIMETPADAYAAVDAEAIPFDDGEFDAVYSQVVLYRLPDPARALREIHRVLAPGGRYLGIERASPWLPPFFRAEARTMRARAEAAGIAERPISLRGWQRVLAEAGFGPECLRLEPGGRVRSARLRRLGNGVRPVYVSIRLTR